MIPAGTILVQIVSTNHLRIDSSVTQLPQNQCMNKLIRTSGFLAFLLTMLSACTTAKLEARLEANPQCKDVYNAKTGALMPCPGSDKSFYVAAGLDAPRQAKAAVVLNTAAASPVAAQTPTPQLTQPNPSLPVQANCKPSIHQKTGGILPCPPLD